MEKFAYCTGLCYCNAIIYYIIATGVYIVKITSVAIKAKRISNQNQLIKNTEIQGKQCVTQQNSRK